MSLPAGTGVWVVKTVRVARLEPSQAAAVMRARASEANAAWPSLRCTTPGSTPTASQRRDAAEAEQRVLREARVGVAVVQARGDPARGPSFSGSSVSSSSSGTRPTSTRQICARDLDVAARDLDRQRRAVVAGDERGGQALGVGEDPVLLLPARVVDALAEVAAAVHEADADHRQRAVGRLLEDVAGERAEAAGVDRQRLVDGVLGAEEGDGVVGVDRAAAARARGRRGPRLERRRPRAEQRVVVGGALERLGGGLLQQPDGVAGDHAPAARVDRAEQLRAARHPGPAVVVGQPRQGRQRVGQPPRQGVGGAGEVVAAISHAGP